LDKDALRKILLIISLPLIIVLFYVIAAFHFHYTPDDTYIYLQYAKNIVRGEGVSFNAGQSTYGMTSPLWMFIIALGGFFGADLFIAAKVVDLMLACSAVIMFYFLAIEIIRDGIVALAATAVFALNAWFLRWAGSGMETSLAVLMVITTVWFCLRNEYYPAAVMAALLTLVRPECFLLLFLLLTDLYLNTVSEKRAIRGGVVVVTVYGVILTPWWIFSMATFRTIFPNTLLAKAGLEFGIGKFLSSLFETLKIIFVSDGITILMLVVSGIIIYRNRSKWIGETEHQNEYRLYLLRQTLLGPGWIIVLVLFYSITDVNVVSRYFLLVIPFLIVQAFFYLDRLIVHLRAYRVRYTTVVICCLAIIIQNQYVYHRYVGPGIDEFEKGMDECLVPIGKWFRDNTPPETRIFASDVGALGYYSDREICDAAGLVSPEMLPLVREHYSFERMMDEGIYRSRYNADYVVYRSFDPEGYKGFSDLTPVFTKVMPRMKLAEVRSTYYTVCKVNHN